VVASLPPSRRPSRADEGFTLMEVMVAFALLAVMASALLVVVGATQKLTREDSARVAANNLASRELEITRDTFAGVTRGPDRVATNRVVNPSPLPGGTAGNPLVVDGVPYTVTREAQWASVNSQVSTCDDGSNAELAYLKVEVEVSWPGLGSRPPVTMDTVMTPLKGTYVATQGHLGLKVIDRLGAPREKVQVTVTSSSTTRTAQTTDDGCVLFAFLDPGSYTVTLSGAGEVDPAGSATATRTVTVQSGQLWRGTQEYDRAATLVAAFETGQGHSLPTDLSKVPVSLGNSALLPNGYKSVTGTGTTRTLTNQWPYASGYQLWGGACIDADPGDTGDLPVASDPGVTATGRVFLPPLQVTTPAAGQVVTATHDAASGCAAYSMVLGTTGGGGVLKTSLPYGTWKLTRSGSTAAPTTVSVLPPSAPTDGTAPTPAVATAVLP